MGFLSGLFGGGKSDSGDSGQAPISQESHYYDPLQADKERVSTPLSEFLSSNVGKGIGEHPTDPNYTNRYNEFMQYNPSEYFDKNISEPAYQQFNKYAKPIIDEGYAGSLRGSGHYGAQEAGYVDLGEQLANSKAQFVPSFAQAQLGAGQTEFARQYQNWYQGLAETNPVLAASINYINSGKQAGDLYAYDTAPSQTASGNFLSQLGNIGMSKLGSMDWGSMFSSFGQGYGSGGMSGGFGGLGMGDQSGINAYSGATGYRDNGSMIGI